MEKIAGLSDQIIKAILQKGKVYEVGGAVRDKYISPILPDKDKDYLITGIPLDELCSLLSGFGKVDLVGKSFGVIKFLPFKKFNGEHVFDIALPRKEYSTGPGHKDFKVEYDHNLRVDDDLSRRDFTINAMAEDLSTGELVDPLNGRKDIKRRLIRITNPNSFRDDPLRMLRGVQFAARFEFELEEETLQSLQKNADLISTISAERIQEELNKLLTKAKYPSAGFRLMQKVGLLEKILPELAGCVGVDQPGGYHAYDVFEHSIMTVDFAPRDLVLRLAALFHDVSKPETKVPTQDGATFYGHEKRGARVARKVLQRLRYSNQIIEQVTLLVDKHMFTTGVTDKGVRRLIRKMGEELVFPLLELRRADVAAQGKGGSTKDVDELEERIRLELERKPPFGLKDLEVKGNDIMDTFNIPPSPLVGQVLNYLLELVLDNPELNQKTRLMKEAKFFLKNISTTSTNQK
ncbi:MAG: HDIG domain-containing protein [candidate division Zixibacteria bacterium]|nr:HDIG domain-containing protein [candidate division Zixibacteria bacterium]